MSEFVENMPDRQMRFDIAGDLVVLLMMRAPKSKVVQYSSFKFDPNPVGDLEERA